LFLFFLRLLFDLPSLVFFFCPFVLICLLVLPFAFCVYRSLPVFCVSTLCLSHVLVFVRPLFIPRVLSVFFPFVFVLRSCLDNGMHRGGEKDVTTICCRFRWIGMKEMNSLLWNDAVLSWGGHSSIWPLELWYLAIRPLFMENSLFFLIWPLDQFQFLILFLIVFNSKN
jgi:hypothetical protein